MRRKRDSITPRLRATDRPDWSCSSGKDTYRTRSLAKGAAKRAASARGATDLEAYRCPKCAHWHVTSHGRKAARQRCLQDAARAALRRKQQMRTHLIFVYGTLKRGHGNHRLLGDAEFVGEFKTEPQYRLYAAGIPFLAPAVDGVAVEGEVYRLDDETLERLDQLEGYRPGAPAKDCWYFRGPVALQGIEGVEAYLWLRAPRGQDVGTCFTGRDWE